MVVTMVVAMVVLVVVARVVLLVTMVLVVVRMQIRVECTSHFLKSANLLIILRRRHSTDSGTVFGMTLALNIL